MTVFEYIQLHPNSTSGEIAREMNRKTAAVSSAVSQLCDTGRIIKSGLRKGIPTYRINNMPFGHNNELTIMFNQLLQNVRRGITQ